MTTSLNTIGRSPIKESFSQASKASFSKSPIIDYTKLMPQNRGKLQPLQSGSLKQSYTRSPYSPELIHPSQSSPPLGENGIMDSMLTSQQSHISKLRNMEKMQQLRSRAFEESVFSSAKAKQDQLDSLIEKRIQEKNLIDERLDNQKKFRVQTQRKELKNYIEDQIAEKSQDTVKTFGSNVSPSKKPDPWQNLQMIEEMRKNEVKSSRKVGAVDETSKGIEENALKFFGVDSGDNEEKELPATSTLKYENNDKLSPIKFTKTAVRNTTYDPITDCVNTYDVSRQMPRTLGSKKRDDIPDKVNMYSPPKNIDFFANRNKGYEIKNPLTGEVKTVQRFRSEDSEEKNLFKFAIK